MTPLLLPRAGLVRAGLLAYYDFSRRNLLGYSEELTASAWSAILATVTANQSLGPGGGNTADRVEIGAAASYVQQGFNFQAGAYTLSVWLRSTLGGAETIRLRIFDGTTAQYSPPLAVTGEWQRYSHTASVAAGAGDVALRAVGDNTPADLLVWGAQLNEGSFALAYEQTDDGQILKDRSGQGQTGTLGSTLGADSNDPAWKQHRLDFDGVDDRVEAPSGGIFTSAGDITVHAWVKPRTFTGWDSLLAFGSGGDEFLFALNGGKCAIYSSHAVPAFVTSPATLSTGSWAFVSLVRRGGQVHFYRNTTKDATLAWDNFALPITGALRGIGGDGGGENFDGEMAHLLIYRRALAPSELRNNYNHTSSILRGRGLLA
jgi:hypothetical protein